MGYQNIHSFIRVEPIFDVGKKESDFNSKLFCNKLVVTQFVDQRDLEEPQDYKWWIIFGQLEEELSHVEGLRIAFRLFYTGW